jgi:uncharacterized membrane protein
VVFSLWITNAGNETDSFRLQPTGTSWQIDSPEVTQPLSPGAAERVTFEVAVPADAAAGTVTIPIQVISEGDPSQSVPVDLIIQVRWQVFRPLFW